MSSPTKRTSTSTGSLQQVGRDGQEDPRIKRYPSTMTSYLAREDQTHTSRESTGYGAGALSTSAASSSSVAPSNPPEASRYNSTTFAAANMPPEARRQSIMAMDRKRRLTGSTYDSGGRRRNMAAGFGERDEITYNRTSEVLPQQNSAPQGLISRHRFSPASSAEVIDLTSSSPPQPTLSPQRLTRRPSGSAPGVYVVPPWQHDSDVTECPICRRPFTFLFRRHHCRKCGRVVCNDCSPHRITIPRQFIVNPPGPFLQNAAAIRGTVDLTGEDEDEDDDVQTPPGTSQHYRYLQNPGIGGGEKVRLCNPCVPDPQPSPQPNFTSNPLPPSPSPDRRDDLLTLSDALRSSRQGYHHNGNIEPFPGFAQQHALSFAAQPPRSRPLPLPPQSRNQVESEPSQIAPFTYTSGDRYRQRGHMSLDNPPIMHHRHHSSENTRAIPQPTTRPRMRSMLDESYSARTYAGQAPIGRPRLSEEDICPICRRALPSKGPGGDESARESHIMGCISARDPSNQSSSSRGLSLVQSPPRGPMHMLPFVATEKDCVGDEGNIPECSICMVEYDVGDELARLECLCKFHRECISAWFTRKQECPVHKIA